MAEIETDAVTTEESLIPTRRKGASMLDRWIESDPAQAIARVETMVRTLEQLRVASIKATYPSDWIIHKSVNHDGEIIRQVGYLQDSGAERAGKVWGIEVGNPAIEREDFPDGTYSYHMLADAWSKVTGERLDYAEGSRWSGDRFFERQKKNDNDRIDPTDVRKSAYANLHGRAVRALSGLNGVPVDTLRQAGLDVDKLVHISYDKGAKGGESTGAAVGSAEVVVGFGQSKGKKPGELADKDLDWYISAYGENVADPGKARFAKANQRVLDALKAEQEQRRQGAKHKADVGVEAGAGEEAPTSIGKLRGDVWAILLDAGGKQAIPLLAAITEELFGQSRKALSELSEEELRKVAQIPAETLKATAKALSAR